MHNPCTSHAPSKTLRIEALTRSSVAGVRAGGGRGRGRACARKPGRSSTSGLTTLSGTSPRAAREHAAAISDMVRRAASRVDGSQCGVRMTLSSARSGSSRGERLVLEDVEAGAGDAAVAEGVDEGGLVDDLAAGDVDEVGAGLHAAASSAAPIRPRVRGVEAVVQADEVGLGEERGEASAPARRRGAAASAGSACGEKARRRMPQGAARRASSRPLAPRPTMPRVLPGRSTPIVCGWQVPAAGADEPLLLGQALGEGEDQQEGGGRRWRGSGCPAR